MPQSSEKEIEEMVERVEVLINRHSPMPNFEVKELCAREIVEYFLSARQKDAEALKEAVKGMTKLTIDPDAELKMMTEKELIQTVREVNYNQAIDDILALINQHYAK